jgi:hypothetical protein
MGIRDVARERKRRNRGEEKKRDVPIMMLGVTARGGDSPPRRVGARRTDPACGARGGAYWDAVPMTCYRSHTSLCVFARAVDLC